MKTEAKEYYTTKGIMSEFNWCLDESRKREYKDEGIKNSLSEMSKLVFERAIDVLDRADESIISYSMVEELSKVILSIEVHMVSMSDYEDSMPSKKVSINNKLNK